MSRAQAIALWTETGPTQIWQPTTLDRLGKSEEFFEAVLAGTPELLGLQSRRSGIHGPFRVFRQVSLSTPTERGIYPDIVLLAASGHVVVVEVKRWGNPELRDRAVIAQLIDYASSFSALRESDLLTLFRVETSASRTWAELIHELFPDDAEPDELAEALFNRMKAGELNLIIACDKVPPGLPEIVEGITSQSALGFELQLVVVVPHVRDSAQSEGVLFVPTVRLATEIVARTAVTVTYRQGDPQPSTHVETTSLAEIEQQVRTAREIQRQESGRQKMLRRNSVEKVIQPP
jgi:hypothetical protein